MSEHWTGRSFCNILPEIPAGPTDAKGEELLAKLRLTNKRARKKIYRTSLNGKGIFVECCFSSNSGLSQISQAIGVKHVRLTRDQGNILDPEVQKQLPEVLHSSEMSGVDLVQETKLKYPQRIPRLRKEAAKAKATKQKNVAFFTRMGKIVLKRGGRVRFEWPSYCKGWRCQELQDFCNERQLKQVSFNTCAF